MSVFSLFYGSFIEQLTNLTNLTCGCDFLDRGIPETESRSNGRLRETMEYPDYTHPTHSIC